MLCEDELKFGESRMWQQGDHIDLGHVDTVVPQCQHVTKPFLECFVAFYLKCTFHWLHTSQIYSICVINNISNIYFVIMLVVFFI